MVNSNEFVDFRIKIKSEEIQNYVNLEKILQEKGE